MSFEITQAIVNTINELCDSGLSHGLGYRKPGHMCVEAAVAYAIGLPRHTDDPGCVNQFLRELKILLNDSPFWFDNKARGKGLRRIAVAQLGTADWTVEQEKEFRTAVIKETILLVKEVYKGPNWNLWADNWLSGKDRSELTASNICVDIGNECFGDDFTLDTHTTDARAKAAFFVTMTVASNFAHFTHVDCVTSISHCGKMLDFCERVVQILIKMETPGSKWL